MGITDIHGMISSSPVPREGGPDLLLVAGDITHFGGRNSAETVLSSLAAPGVPVMAVPGNCDGDEVLEVLEQRELSLHKRIQTFQGISLYGIGGSLPGPGRTPRELSEKEFSDYLDNLAEEDGLEGGILVCHQPPHGTKIDRAMGIHHVGSKAVRRCIERLRPRLCLSGHIHESSGIDRVEDTVVVNPGPFKNGRYVLCEITDSGVKCTFGRI